MTTLERAVKFDLAWVDAAVVLGALTEVLPDPYASFPTSRCQTSQTGEDSCGLSHSPLLLLLLVRPPSSSSRRLLPFTSLSSARAGLRAQSALFLSSPVRGCKICPDCFLFSPPRFYLRKMKPQKTSRGNTHPHRNSHDGK